MGLSRLLIDRIIVRIEKIVRIERVDAVPVTHPFYPFSRPSAGPTAASTVDSRTFSRSDRWKPPSRLLTIWEWLFPRGFFLSENDL